MDLILVILLATIAYFLWRIYSQRNEERIKTLTQEDAENRDSELAKKFPHLVGNIESNWIQVFESNSESGISILKLSWLSYEGESTKIDFSDGSFAWDNLWNLSEELLEHLEQFHEGSNLEHEIAISYYWQLAAEAMGDLVAENPVIEGSKMEVEPFTNISKILSFFPKKDNDKLPINVMRIIVIKISIPGTSKGR
jgi:hypothetical protein